MMQTSTQSFRYEKSDSDSDQEDVAQRTDMALKRASGGEEKELSFEEALLVIKRQRTLLEAEQRIREATENVLQQHRRTTEWLTTENATLRRDRDKMSQALDDARQGLRADAPVVSYLPEMETPDPTDLSVRVPTLVTMQRLAAAMVVKARCEETRKVILDVLRFDARSMSGTTSYERMSFHAAFNSNNLSVDMWGDVCMDSDVFQALWSFCVCGVERRTTRSRRSPPGRPYQRALKGSTAKVRGKFTDMLWHDGRTETADKWCTTQRLPGTAMSGVPLAPVPSPTRGSTLLTPSVSSLCMATKSSRSPNGISAAASAEESSDPDSDDEECSFSTTTANCSMPPPPPPSLCSPSPSMDVRAPIPQHTERLIPDAAVVDSSTDTESCAGCGERGAVTRCDGFCGNWYHWWCERPNHQPDAERWYCTGCERHAFPEWAPKPDCYAQTKCVVCMERKPRSQFATLLPECSCADKGNLLCALCACTIDLKADAYTDVRCPTCNMPKTSLKMADGMVVNLVHRADENGGCEKWVIEAETETEFRPPSEEDLLLEAEEIEQKKTGARLKEAGAAKAARLAERNARKANGEGSASGGSNSD